MISPGALEDAVLSLLCFSDEHAVMLALRVPSELFSNITNQKIALVAREHVTRFSAPPKSQLEYLLEAELMRGAAGQLLGQQIDSLTEQFKGITPEFIIQELDNWIEIQRATKALTLALEHLQQGDLLQARIQIAKSTSNTNIHSTPGIKLNDPDQSLQFLYKDEDEGFPIGIETIERLGSVPARKTLSFFLASASKGKSWALVNVGAACAYAHKRVMHITLENSQDMTAQRYIQRWFSLNKRDAKELNLTTFLADGAKQYHTLTRPGINGQVREIRQKLKAWGNKLPIYIKEFPTGTLTVEELDLYLDAFERSPGGFKPDVLILDYADLMNIDADNMRIATGRMFMGLRGIAVRRNLALITAAQSNRDGDDARSLKRTNIAEDWSKFGTADNAYIYSQTAAEHKIGLARINVAKSRAEIDNYTVLISQSYAIGQFCIDSTFLAGEVLEDHKAILDTKPKI